jgi:hypothetical protein
MKVFFRLDHDRHGRRDQRRGVGTDDQVDFVDVEQLRIDRRHLRGRALVVVVDELDRTAEEPALGVDIFFPNLLGEQRRFAVGRKPAGQRHAEADLDRLAGLRPGRAGEQQCARRELRADAGKAIDYPPCCVMLHRHPPMLLVSCLLPHLRGNRRSRASGR